MRSHRFLFVQLFRRELRQKYQGSALGVLWYLVNPVVLMGAYTLMFGFVLHAQTIPDYPLFLMVGLVVWTFFQGSVLAAGESLILQGSLIRKARFPREAIPGAAVAVQFVTLLAVLVLVVCVAIGLRGALTAWLLLTPVMLVLLFAFTFGAGLVVAVLHAHFRDVLPIVSALLLPWFFVTPIFFQANRSLAPIRHHPWVGTALNWFNPLAPFVEATRTIVYGAAGGGRHSHSPEAGQVIYAVVAALVSLALGRLVFTRMQRDLAVVL